MPLTLPGGGRAIHVKVGGRPTILRLRVTVPSTATAGSYAPLVTVTPAGGQPVTLLGSSRVVVAG